MSPSVAELLVDPQADVGRTGEQLRLRQAFAQRGEFVERLRGVEAPRAGAVVQGLRRGHRVQRGDHRGGVERRLRQLEHALAGVEDGPVAGAAAQVARQLVGELLACRDAAAGVVVLVRIPHRHHEARGAEAALRAVALDHRLLGRVQRAVRALQVLDSEERLAVQRRQELDAGVDRPQRQTAHGRRVARGGALADHDRAGAAVALVAALLGAGAARVFAQPVEHAAGRCGIDDLDDLTTVEEADRATGHGGAQCGAGQAQVTPIRSLRYTNEPMMPIILRI